MILVSVLVLTKNEEQDLPKCLRSVAWCDDIHVYDSFSDDRTIEIAIEAGAKVTQRKFDNWAAHQNWGLANIPFKYSWVLYIDADEQVSVSLYNSLMSFATTNVAVAFNIRRRDFAWDNTWLKHSQMSAFYLRLFRPEKMRYERLVNPVSLPDGPTSTIDGFLITILLARDFSSGYNVTLAMLHWKQLRVLKILSLEYHSLSEKPFLVGILVSVDIIKKVFSINCLGVH